MIIVDVETTGTNPYKHGLLSVAAVDFNNPEYIFYEECRIDDRAEIQSEALKINGFTLDQIRDLNKKSAEQMIKDFINWTKECKNLTFAGENPSLDKDFLRVACERAGIEWQFGYRTVDLHSLAYAELLKQGIELSDQTKLSILNLSKTLEFLGLPPQPTPHNALADAKMEAEAVSRIIYKRGLFPEFGKYPVLEFSSELMK